MRLRAAALLAATPLLALTGCVSLGPKPPATLLALHPSAGLAPDADHSSDDKRALAVAQPTVQPGLATMRVMVEDGPTAVAYLKGTQWVAPPGQIFRDLLAETITARTGRVVPDSRIAGFQPDTRLSGHLVQFGLVGGAHAAVVTFDAAIVRNGQPTVETRRFTAQAPVSAEDGPTVGAAVNVAANQVASQVADWIGTR